MYLTYPLDETVSLWKQKPIDYITYHLGTSNCLYFRSQRTEWVAKYFKK
jgi:hypothetical protein